ncbi:undecaprenyldiphospho-muramoylpentapeptide beta-N-acetylglucosaminyltransferase [Candidatus Methylomicrobium oryzae]|jgi:UDP-N-acetylglucosamine--N-acetylmuramyl-(pentapeptide) pyrophosphoryl-undecaprenol N-acetylglucosamine transferase|uniref:undecaprenyldiphospho-muramoylpentapeptide beta-N-acetylglucosaminyltransferase n=1 Tax=Candidatus Methylomicrobium oryzae TaxID=2802053 RepID=UPI0019207910|nr:undecaprenyldiphospho-muramoylpentapeptide beta-N-acetylglucosaminyltransferase [Methylomicrobium sp. RS1]MBL1263162.1 undecaprenyldiphospho-muramoylpentapeptide beta-N-acetylglucosaminyltransferase [Methylomicrobium sp. RS1]
MAKRIVIMAGGTGGHVFPALAVAESLLEKGWEVSWLGTRNGLEARVVPEHDIAIDWLSVAGVRGKGMLSKATAVFKLLKACLQAASLLRKRKPDVVLGMGGFVAGPGGLMARMLGIPLIIHEQNRVPGTTNRWLARLASRVLEAFPDSFDKKRQAICTGNPLRKKFLLASEMQHAKPEQDLKLLIVGGSQGAQRLNEIVPEAMGRLSGIHVIHQTGPAMQEQVAARYRELGVNAEARAFIQDMAEAYEWADLAICRAGAMTVSELAAIGCPAILVPLPWAIDDHQVANAHYLADAGAGLILLQKDLTPESLAEAVADVRNRLPVMAAAAKQCARLDATETVAHYCIAEAN